MPTYAERHVVTVITNSDGDATAYTPDVTGLVKTIRYVKTDFVNGVDFTITAEKTGETIWTDTNIDASETVAPRQATHDTAGAASLFDTVSNEPVEDHIHLVQDRVKIVVASGGDTKVGTFHVVIG